MNQWFWIIAIFGVAFVLLVFLRQKETEGFGEFQQATTQFVNKQDDFFSKLLKKGLFINNGLSLGNLNAAVTDNNIYNIIPEKKDMAKYFSPDPYAEYFDYDKTFCKPARHPRNLPSRDPTKRSQCGWWYVPDASVPSVGVLGTREEALVKPGLPPNGQWIWDINKAIELEDKKFCKRIKSCDLMDLPSIQGICGFCERLGHAVPIHRDGREKYPDSSDACGEKTVTSTDGCYRPPPPELITDDGINCGNYGRPSSNNQTRLYTKSECDALNGNFVPNGECLIKSGGSYSAACAGLNTPFELPNAPRAKCDPDAKGNLTRECLISLAKGLGYNESGGVLRMLMGNMGPNQTDKYALEVLRGKGLTIPDAILGTGNIDKLSAATIYSDLYNAMTTGFDNVSKQAAKWLVSGTDSFDICDFDASKTGPFPVSCLQREFRQAGCQPAGAQHPTEANAASIQGLSWGNIQKRFKDLYASMSSTNSETQRTATKDCLGIDFYRAPDKECGCHIMFGPWINWGVPLKVDRTMKLPDGKSVHLLQEGTHTKMVHESGEGRYFIGKVENATPNDWNNAIRAPHGVYNARKGVGKECEPRKLPPYIALKGGRANRYCTDAPGKMVCNTNWVLPWEKYNVVELGNDTIALRGGREWKTCADDAGTVRCNRDWIGPWEKFKVEHLGNNRITLRGGREGKLCADDGDAMRCNRDARGPWEIFTWEKAPF
jgi:hypothetical protein